MRTTGVMDWILNAGSNVRVVLEGLGFNLCVVPFLNICVPNFKLESISQRWSEFGQRSSTKNGTEWNRSEGARRYSSRLVGYE